MKKILLFCFISLCFVSTIIAQSPDANGIFYVKQYGTGNQRGDSWNNAIADVAIALKAAQRINASVPGYVKQIWVSGGTYTPQYVINGAVNASSTPDNRNNTFLLVKDVKIYGGFAGNETALANRDLSLTANASILSGDLGTENDNTDNAYHVVAASGDVGTATLNGFTITGGNANGGSGTITVGANSFYLFNGAGIYLMGASPTLANIQVVGNTGTNFGIGVCATECTSNITFTNAIISGNGTGAYGGGVGLTHSVATFNNTTICGNNATNGGGTYAFDGCTLTYNNSVMYGNSSGVADVTGGYGANTISVQYSLVQGKAADAANHISDPATNPLFVNAPSYTTAPFTNGNYTFSSTSPLINAGSNSLFPSLSATSTDAFGKSRVTDYGSGGIIDIGAYEFAKTTPVITAGYIVKTYGDADFEPGATVSSGLSLTYASADNTIAQAYQDAGDGNKWKIAIKKAGTVLITVSQAGTADYNTVSDTFNVIINKAALTVTAKDAAKVYNGLAYSGGNGVTYSGFVKSETETVLSGTVAYTGSSQNAVTVNSYIITPGGLTADNYTILYMNGSLTISKAPLLVTAEDLPKDYDGVAFSGGNGVFYTGFVHDETESVLSGTVTYSGTSQGAKNAGSYAITPGGLSADNYAIQYVSGQLSINRVILTVTANDTTKVYDGVAFSGGNGITYSGFVNNETEAVLSGTLTYSSISQGAIYANSYLIIPGGLSSGNYFIQFFPGRLVISKASLTVTAKDAAKVYDGLAYAGGNGVTYAGLVNNETAAVLSGTVSYTGTSQGAVAVNDYVITPGGLSSDNYIIQYADGNLEISKASLIVTAQDTTKVYDGLAYSGGNGVTYTGFVNNETASVLTGTVTYTGTSQGAVDADSYIITPGGLGSGNYTIQYTAGNLKISKAGLTITAKDAARVYDGLAYTGGNGVTYAGFVNNETAAVLIGTITYSGTSQGAIDANSYVITPGGVSSANYAIQYADGSLVISKASLTITAKDAAIVYDGLAYSGGNGVSYAGFVNNETATVLTGTVTYSGTSQGAINVNSYVIIPGGVSSGNYTIQFADGSLTISKASLTITAKNSAKVYDGLAYAGGNGVTYSGLVNNETAAVLSGTISYSGTAQGATDVNTYVITPGGLSSGNYAIQYADGSLIISKAALTVTAKDAAKVYDGLAYTGGNGVTYTGLVNNETEMVLSGAVVYSGTSQGATNVNSYVITPGGLSSGNYAILYADGGLTISRAALSVIAADTSKIYDGLAFTGGNGVSYTGFVNNETASVLSGGIVYTGTAQGATNVDNYEITPGGLNSDNYAIQYVNGSLSISKASLTVVATDTSKVYDGLSFTGSNGVTYAGLVNNESAAVLGGMLTYGGTSQGAVRVNDYVIVPDGLTSGNYDIHYVNGTLAIQKALLVVSADNKARCYGDANPGLTISYTGFVHGEDSTALGVLPVATTAVTTQTVAGNYQIVPSGAAADNYSFSYVNGVLTIYALPVSSITAAQGTVLCGTSATLPIEASGAYSFTWLHDNVAVTGTSAAALTVGETGSYSAIATDGNGCSAPVVNNIAISRLLAPQAAFTFDSYCVDNAVSFTNTSEVVNSGTVNYSWSSGNGESSNHASPQFIYSAAGSYTVTLTVTPQSCTSLAVTTTQVIPVEAAIPGMRLTTVNTSPGLPVQLQARNLTNASYNWLPFTGLSDAASIAPVAILQQDQDYQIEMAFPSGCITIDSLHVSVYIASDILVPNVFSANGDGQNDILYANLRGMKKLNYFRVFDRWGKKVFESFDAAKGWDGTYNGELQPLATYVWAAEGVDNNGKTIHRQGSVTLLR